MGNTSRMPFEKDFLEKFPNSLLIKNQCEKNKRWIIYEII